MRRRRQSAKRTQRMPRPGAIIREKKTKALAQRMIAGPVGTRAALLLISAPKNPDAAPKPVSYTHLRANETVLVLVCRLLLVKKKNNKPFYIHSSNPSQPSPFILLLILYFIPLL